MSHPKMPRNALIAVIICALGTFFRLGYILSIFNPTVFTLEPLMKTMLKNHYGITNEKKLEVVGTWLWSLITGIAFLFACFGAMTVTFFGRNLRKNGLIITQVIYIVGSLISCFAYFKVFELMILGQAIVGFALGFGNAITTPFIDEISHPAYSQTLYTFLALSIEVGTCSANFLGVEGILGGEKLWPIAFAFPCIFNVICIVFLVIGQKETPIRLLRKNKKEEALKSIQFYYQLYGPDAEKKLSHLEKEMKMKGSHTQKTTWQALTERKNRKALLLSTGTNVLVNFSGVLAISIFGSKLMVDYGQMGDKHTMASLINAGVFTSTFFGLLFALLVLKNVSHRLCLLIGVPAMLVVDVAFMIVMLTTKGITAVVLIGILIVLFNLAFSNSVEKIMCFNGAMYTDPEYLDATSSITVAATYLSTFIVPQFYYPLSQIQPGGEYTLFMFIIPLAIAWVCYFFWYPHNRSIVPDMSIAPEEPELKKNEDEIKKDEDEVNHDLQTQTATTNSAPSTDLSSSTLA